MYGIKLCILAMQLAYLTKSNLHQSFKVKSVHQAVFFFKHCSVISVLYGMLRLICLFLYWWRRPWLEFSRLTSVSPKTSWHMPPWVLKCFSTPNTKKWHCWIKQLSATYYMLIGAPKWAEPLTEQQKDVGMEGPIPGFKSHVCHSLAYLLSASISSSVNLRS